MKAATRRRTARAARAAPGTIVGKLKAADPFELIRWLARSQPDPRKALAELVQNSIDAGARHVEITRIRERGVLTLHVLDDGEGVIPEMPRTDALGYIATHVGHSRKRNLTPEQRRELLTQGKYGIGLLGFWAIGVELEMRSQVPGEPAWLLRLHEDSPHYEIERFRGRLPFGDRYTEVLVRGLHRAAAVSLTARRTADFLAAELRGQLLARETDVVVHDRVARGLTPKVLAVKPARYSGEPIALPEEVECPGFSPVRVELYLLPEPDPEHGRVSIFCGGTVVHDDVAELEVADFRRPPWTSGRLTGLVEFPDFQVPPGTRRGVVPDEAAVAFVETLASLEPAIEEHLRSADERAAVAVGADLLRQLERAFREVPKLAPEYDFFAVRAADAARRPGGPVSEADGGELAERGDVDATQAEGTPGASGVALDLAPAIGLSEAIGDGAAAADAETDELEPGTLFPPGPLASLEVIPAETRVEQLGERRLRAEPRDARGERIRRDVVVAWQTESPLARVEPREGLRTAFRAGPATGAVEVVATARQGERTARATARIEIVEAGVSSPGPRTGIPEPVFVHEPAAGWRSRMAGGRWEVNSGHPDFGSASGSARRKLRYLAALLAKEVVLHSFPSPQLAPALERLVEVLTITERGLDRG